MYGFPNVSKPAANFTEPPTPASVVDWLDWMEDELSTQADRVLSDDRSLGQLASGWRAALATATGIPADRRTGDPMSVARLVRGGQLDGLGDDYPAGLHEQTRASWVAAACSAAMQQWSLDFGLGEESARLSRLTAALREAPAPAFAPTASRVVLENDDLRLREVVSTKDAAGTPLVVVGSLINRWYVLDFLEGKSFLGMVSELGRPVYLVEWLPPAQERDDRGLGELTAGPLREAIDAVCAERDTATVSLAGYCMGGTFATLFAARYPARVERLATVCTPTRFSGAGPFARWFAPGYVDVDQVLAAFDRVPAWMVHMPFWWLRPTIKIGKLVHAAKAFEGTGYLEHMLALEIWNHDNVDQSRGVFRDWIGRLYQDDALVEGRMTVDGQAVRLDTIECPTLVVAGGADNITPPDACEALLSLISSETTFAVEVPSGHVGVLTSKKALALEAGAFAEWLAS